MKQILLALLLLGSFIVPSFAKTHKDTYDVSCSKLWPAVKDVLRNSGKYGIIGIDSNEMTASYNIGGFLGGKRINSLVLNTHGEKCEMQLQTAFSGLVHDDAGDFKKRVDAALAKLQTAEAPQTPQTAVAPEKTPEPGKSEERVK